MTPTDAIRELHADCTTDHCLIYRWRFSRVPPCHVTVVLDALDRTVVVAAEEVGLRLDAEEHLRAALAAHEPDPVDELRREGRL